jgi:hypothetical protein
MPHPAAIGSRLSDTIDWQRSGSSARRPSKNG